MFFVSSDDGVTVSSLTVPDTPLVTDGDSESYGKPVSKQCRRQELTHPKTSELCLWVHSTCQSLMLFVCTKYF